MSDQERDFKGIWIPKEIYLDPNLNWTEKITLIEIDSLDGNNGCFASNEHFAKHLMISKDRAGKIINKLVQEGYVIRNIIYKQGTKQIDKRILRSTIRYSQKQLEGIGKNDCNPLVENNQDNNTNINNKKEKRKTEFDELINQYTENKKLKDTIYEFIKHRKSIKSTLTTLALKKIITKLDVLAKDDNTKIAILENSIMNGWRGVFPLGKDDNVIPMKRNETPTVSIEIDKSKLGGI